MKHKKIFIIIAIILMVILLGFGIFSIYKYVTPVTITSSNNTFTLQIPGKVKFKEAPNGSSEYVLDIYYLKDQMMLYSTIIENVGNINLEDAVKSEKDNITNSRDNARDVSDISKLNISNYEAYKYSFIYHDASLNSDLFSNVVWIKTDKRIYILDLEVITKNQSKYTKIFDEIINSFKEI